MGFPFQLNFPQGGLGLTDFGGKASVRPEKSAARRHSIVGLLSPKGKRA
jgi:hypothetical protein